MVPIGFLIAVVALLPAAQAQTAASASSDTMVIDGKKNPSQLPEWLVWEHGFMQIAMLKGKETSLTELLKEGLSAQEFELLEREAAAQDDRLEAAAKEAEPLREQYQKRDPEDTKLVSSLNERMQEVNLRYRRATLDARDRVLQTLRPESQSVVLAWLGELRAGIVARVSKSELERWRAPE
jgi:Skp family chaperone for outer membrane proteins